MYNTITSEILVAYSQCSRKAFLLLCTDELGMPYEYIGILEQQKRCSQINYMHALEQPSLEENSHLVTDLTNEGDLVIKATLKTEGLEAYCDVLTQVESSSSSSGSIYEPTLVIGTYHISKEQELELAFTGFVLGQMQGKLPVAGHIVKMGGQAAEIKLEPYYRVLKPFLDPLRAWLRAAPPDPPPIILNKHCPSCQFRALCREKAEKEDDLSLLDRMTSKVMQRYHKKGVFTVTQLSYLYKPRRNRKQSKKTTTPHKLELQALAIRTNKIYIHDLPQSSPGTPLSCFWIRHLQKFRKQIDQFYERVIMDRTYHSDLTMKYQSRFKRYRPSLFTFIEQDGIPWNNNMAERAIRHLAVQRKISGFFFKSVAPQYLLMLGITQTCRFQKKSLLKFLMSGEKDIDQFKATRPLKRSTLTTPLSRLKKPEDN